MRAINTICGATDELQEAAWKMAGEVEVAMVIGGAKSANTRRLRELCEEAGIPAYQVETASDIQDVWLEGKSIIGITAGASTPDWLIEEVARKMNGGNLPDNWLKTSSSSMYTYIIAKAVERGYVDQSYMKDARKGYQGVLTKISLDADGMTNLTDICEGTNVADLAYYLARKRNVNDFHGLGAFLIMNEYLMTVAKQ